MTSDHKTAKEMVREHDFSAGVMADVTLIRSDNAIRIAEDYATQEVAAERRRLHDLDREEITELRAEVARLRKEASKRHREDQKWVAKQVAAARAEEAKKTNRWMREEASRVRELRQLQDRLVAAFRASELDQMRTSLGLVRADYEKVCDLAGVQPRPYREQIGPDTGSIRSALIRAEVRVKELKFLLGDTEKCTVEFTPIQLAILAVLLGRCVEWTRLPDGAEVWSVLCDGMVRTAGDEAMATAYRAVPDAGGLEFEA